MKNKYYIIFFAALLLLVFAGCDENFLDVQPTDVLTDRQLEEAAENNPDVIAGYMSGIYTLMFQVATGGSDPAEPDHDDFGQKGYDIYSDFLSGDMALSVSTYGWYRDLTELTPTVDYTDIENYRVWRYYYRLIRSANSVIATLGGNDAVPELEENKHIMGQAKAMRAHSYFYLTQFFSQSYDPAAEILPVYTDPTQPNQPKSTTEEVFNLILNDLTDAIELLETFERAQKTQINKYVAEGILAYVYAYLGGNENYQKAQDLTADVINNGGFSIMDSTEIVFRGDYSIGGFNNVSSPGWMWGVDLTVDNELDLVSWWGQMDAYTYSYQWAGDRKAIDQGLYNRIPQNDYRKLQFHNDPASGYYLVPLNKFYAPVDRSEGYGQQRTITTDYVYMRVAEMYLLNAEVAAKRGDETTAKQRLKELLKLRVPDVSEVDGLSGQELLDEIYLQTRIELWGEGKSYLALKRNKATVVRGSNHLSLVGEPIPYDDPRLTFEIPQSEVQNNPFID